MCCFSQSVNSVSATNIFARAGINERQTLVYSMNISADKELAMVLPIPVKANAGEKDVEFIDLKEYPDFFVDLAKGFPIPAAMTSKSTRSAVSAVPTEALQVHEVGEFEASFVPAVKDFARLDKRFQMPPGTWDKLPQYKSYGFAVFKLKPGAKTVHPMAFSFSRADAAKVFFPTVHIHDGEVHAKADFDHTLYIQPRTDQKLEVLGWLESASPAMNFMQIKKAKGVIAANEHCYRQKLRGMLANQDTWVNAVA
jgi:hypothetical protein